VNEEPNVDEKIDEQKICDAEEQRARKEKECLTTK